MTSLPFLHPQSGSLCPMARWHAGLSWWPSHPRLLGSFLLAYLPSRGPPPPTAGPKLSPAASDRLPEGGEGQAPLSLAARAAPCRSLRTSERQGQRDSQTQMQPSLVASNVTVNWTELRLVSQFSLIWGFINDDDVLPKREAASFSHFNCYSDPVFSALSGREAPWAELVQLAVPGSGGFPFTAGLATGQHDTPAREPTEARARPAACRTGR